jgi:RNA polymerase sigma-70 factor (ECF subfamily)
MDLAGLVERHQTAVWRYLRSMGADAALAEELTQETFVVAWQRGIVDRGESAVGRFLCTTAKHRFLRCRRDQGRREELLAELADRVWLRDCEGDAGEAWLAALRQCTGQLDGRTRTAVHLCYGPAQDRAAAARTLGLKANGLKTLLQRARLQLRRCIERKLGDAT